MLLNEKRLPEIFNEWARRYAENPSAFSEILDENGQPFADYGEASAKYFMKIASELK